ncbi:hypothetical protein NUH86_23180 (plasmid) [Sphingobium sp. JS3065]|uniref:hypothetical protein n=1 Tax=Sphingobium sp. JS3065 TaxID=2970925 RepID=UPI002263B918|nr:hypothetical protein [Sphingobium sp. JS3065]UZW57908.1 hypothetical protein NUH86_23180 [Sphingobium sp. JS3065]
MTAEHAALFQATRPTVQERASDRWNDDAAPLTSATSSTTSLFRPDNAAHRDDGIKTQPLMVAAVKDSRVFTVASTTKGDASSALLFNAASKTRDTTRGIDAAPGR